MVSLTKMAVRAMTKLMRSFNCEDVSEIAQDLMLPQAALKVSFIHNGMHLLIRPETWCRMQLVFMLV